MSAAAANSPTAKTRRTLRLTESLKEVLRRAKGKKERKGSTRTAEPITLELIVDSTADRAFGVLMAFLCLPFLAPITIPFASIPFGAAIFLLGLQVAICKNRPWLPQWLLKWKLPQKFTGKLLKFAAKIFRPLERVIHPRLGFMQHPAGNVVAGVALALDGILLALPWPPGIPLTNTIPAWMALIKILGLTERDGAALLVGSILTYVAVTLFVVAVVVIAH